MFTFSSRGFLGRRAPKLNHAPLVSPAPEPPTIDAKDPVVGVDAEEFWRRYAPTFNKNTTIDFTTPKFQDYLVNTKRGRIHIRSMLTQFELALLYALGKDYYTGRGKIVDLGPLAGVGTNCLARGLSHNARDLERTDVIYSYDLFLLAGMRHFLPSEYDNGTASIFQRFLELNRDFQESIVIVPGDFLQMSWGGYPIEILFIDLAKTWKLNKHVIANFFPHLFPGSIVIQQDYVHFGEPWVALTMEYFEEYFERLYFIYGATAVYRCIKKIPEDKLSIDFEAMELDEMDRLFASARTKVTPAIAEVLKTAQARAHLLKGDLEGAKNWLDQVNLEARDGGDVATEFRGSLKAGFNGVKREIDRVTAAPSS